MEDKISKEYLSTFKFVGEAGAGLVKVTVDGLGFPIKVEIDPSIFSETNAVLVSDLFVAATKDGIDKADLEVQEIMVKAYMNKIQEYESCLDQYDAAAAVLDKLGGGKYNN
jgi:DNA-binding protein YbaB